MSINPRPRPSHIRNPLIQRQYTIILYNHLWVYSSATTELPSQPGPVLKLAQLFTRQISLQGALIHNCIHHKVKIVKHQRQVLFNWRRSLANQLALVVELRVHIGNGQAWTVILTWPKHDSECLASSSAFGMNHKVIMKSLSLPGNILIDTRVTRRKKRFYPSS